ncbi:SixA phosphatase family protein [Ideonella sp. BN130291]|uniref:SixA phosphatase family protein n=1 Tax=Ideonella sp. BN130291 TaxID=3112940 RepID=UPI002E25B941|nr:histidine phosphatase family protein [Ideonella sp. BN130291]
MTAMEILLWRHADAFDARPGQDDSQRALTPKGLEQARRMARWLNSVLPADTRVIASPAQRTQQTAQALGREVQTVAALAPGASVQAVLQAADWPNAKVPVLVVGHQPTMGLVASWLMTGQQQHWWVQKAGVWWLRSERDDRATLLAMRTPEHEPR